MYILYLKLDEASECYFRGLSWRHVPPAYRARLKRMQSPAARARTQAGLWLLARGLRALDSDASAVFELGFSAHGRPEIAGAPAFSITHSKALVACALARGQAVGLDVEALRPVKSAWRARLVGDGEARAAALDPRRFFDFWCAREAAVKASGRVGLARIRALTLHAGHARIDGCNWPLHPLELAPGYAACLASDRPIGAIEIVKSTIPV